MSAYNEYIAQLEDRFGTDATKILLLKTAFWVNPLLGEYGKGVFGPIAVITDTFENAMRLLKELEEFGDFNIKSTNLPPKKLFDEMKKSRYGISLFQFSEGRYTYENLQQMQELCNPLSLNIEERKIAIVFVVGGVCEKYANCFCGQIYFNCEMWSNYECTDDLGNQYLRELITFLVKTGSLSDIWTSGVEESFWLVYVKDLLIKFFSAKRSKSVVAKLKSQDTKFLLERALEEWEGEYDSEFFCKCFLSVIYEYPFFDAFNRMDVPVMELSDLNLILLVDEEYYHIGYDMFCKICESLKDFGSLGVIKNELLRAGILVAEGCKRGYFTKRTDIMFEDGSSVCKRMVRLRRNKIDMEFSLSLAEMIKTRREENEAGAN